MLTIEKSECLPPPRPRSPAFIDTLSSCLTDGTQKSYLSIFFFFFQNQIYCISSLHLAKHAQTVTHDLFFQKFVLVTFVMRRRETILAYLALSCADKNKNLAKLEEEIRSVRSVYREIKNILIIVLEVFILSRVRTKVLASQTRIRSFVHM